MKISVLFTISLLLALVGLLLFAWTLSLFSFSFTECNGIASLSADSPGCRRSRMMHYVFKLSLLGSLGTLWWGLISRRRSIAVERKE